MPTKLQIIKPDFYLDVVVATGYEVENLIPVYGFIGDWKNPSHIVVTLDDSESDDVDLWLIDFCDLEQRLQGAEASQLENIEDIACNVWFTYKGDQRDFLEATKRWTGRIEFGRAPKGGKP